MPTYSTPIDPRNLLGIFATLHHAERGYRTRQLNAEQVMRAADCAEQRVQRLGLDNHHIVAVIHPEAAPREVGGASATAAILQRVAYGWLLIAAARVPTRNLIKPVILRKRLEVLIAVEQVTGTLIEIGDTMGMRFVEVPDAGALLRVASGVVRVPLPGDPNLFVGDGRGRLRAA